MKYFELFHFYSKKRKGSEQDPHDTSLWPASWKTTFYKQYERFTVLPLPEPLEIQASLKEVTFLRGSGRKYRGTMTAQELSTLLFYSCGEYKISADAYKRVYASGGARYPIETYVLLLSNVGDLGPGVYHYSVHEHGLVDLRIGALDEKILTEIFLYPETQTAAAVFIYTAVFSRQVEKYGNRGYRHTLMEVGGISEHLGMAAAGLGVSQCPMSGFLDERIEEILDIDGITESVVHTVVVG